MPVFMPGTRKPSQRSIVLGASDGDLEEWETRRSRYQPGSLNALCSSTKFSRKEIQAIYHGFKQDCPNGSVTKEKFKELYAQFYPLGGTSLHYAAITTTM